MNRRIFIWRGYHSQDAYAFFRFCWDNDHLLICAPPSLTDFSFIRGLPSGEISFCGQWSHKAPSIVQSDGGVPFPDNPVLGVFTTGTTQGRPKLVLYSKNNIIACQDGILSFFKMDRINTVFCYPQPYHVFGLLLGYALCHHRRLRLIFGDGKYNAEHHQARIDLHEDRVLTLATPTHARDLASYLHQTNQHMTASYSCILGGAKVNVADWKLARNRLKIRRPSIGYGCTEASPGIAHLPPGRMPLVDGEIGYPLRQLTINVTSEGEFECTGPSIAMATIQNGFVNFPQSLHVKDSVDWADDGRLVFRGRTDMVLNRGGEKFALERIESILRMHLDLHTVCVALPHDRLGEALGVLASAPRTRKVLTAKTINKTLAESLGRDFPELKLKTISELPTNHNAKLDRITATKLLLRD